MINIILKKIYKLVPSKYQNSSLFINLKILYWKYFQNFKRFKELKKNKFQLTKKHVEIYKEINKKIKINGIVVEKPEIIFNSLEINTLKKILNLSNEKIKKFENEKNSESYKNFFNSLKERQMFKPFRYDLGDYLNFKDRKLDANNFNELHYEILKIGLKDEFLYIASLYLGIYPFLGRFYAWYDFPINENAVSSQCWHRDSDDRKFLKIFIYLNEVKNDNGPFCFIKNTHFKNNKNFSNESEKKTTKYSKFNILTDKDVKIKFAPEEVKECFGNFGTTIFADTSGFHKGKSLENKKRIMLVFEYFSQTSSHSYKININEKMSQIFTKKQLLALKKI